MQYVISACFILTFLIVFLCTNSWFSIARIHTTMWLFLYIGYCSCSVGHALEGNGVFWLIASCFFILFGEKIGEQGVVIGMHSLQPVNIQSKSRENFWIMVIIVFSLLSIIGNFAEIYAYGFNLKDLTSFSRILNMSNKIAIMRYSGLGGISAVITLLQTQKYIACLASGYYFLLCKKKSRRLIAGLPFIPVILNVLIENTKAGVIACFVLFLIGLIIGYASIKRRYLKFTIKSSLKYIILFCAIIVLLVFAMMIRLGEISSKTFDIVSKKFVVYAFGNIQAFDVWLSKLYCFDGLEFGINTFMAPFKLMGIVSREQGVYGFIDGVASNVFSGYRGVIEDFGVIGGLVFVMLLGYVGGRSTKRIIKYPTKIMPKIVYLFVSFFVIYSYIISPYVYSSFCIMIMEFAFLLYMEKQKYFNN